MDKIRPSLREPKYSLMTPSYKLVITGALAMQLGCHFSEEFRAELGISKLASWKANFGQASKLNKA